MNLMTPSDAETAYYAAFANADMDAMKAVWLDAPSVVCTHPMAERILGYRLIMGSFLGLFQHQGPLSVTLERLETMVTPELAIHTGVEVLHQDATEFRMQVTNAYRSTDDGWRMVLHHASPVHAAEPPSRLDSQVH